MRTRTGFAAVAILLLGLAAGCAKTDDDMQPSIVDKEMKLVLQGKWRIERVNNKLCRSGSCSSVVYAGAPEDYFEFKTDSAFLQRGSYQNANSVYRDRFKADYAREGGFTLSNFGWSAWFRVIQHDPYRLVLEGTYAGNDPSAIFTDTYYLYR